jgi:hypothetical protein
MTNWQVSCILGQYEKTPISNRLAMYITLSFLKLVDDELVILFESKEFERIYYLSNTDIINFLTKFQVKHIIALNRQQKIMIASAILLGNPNIIKYITDNITYTYSAL